MKERMEEFKKILSKNLCGKQKAVDALPEIPENMIEGLVRELASKESFDSINRDPYWPKWDSPWWKMALLHEMGMTERIPEKTLMALLEKIDSQYIHLFPRSKEELPENCDPYREIICHCALGIIWGLFSRTGIDLASKLPWTDRWFLKYQLKDGGFNCDDEAYRRSNSKSSFYSTLPPLEALLYYNSEISPENMEILEKGARYLIDRRLCRSVSKNMSVIKSAWFKPIFPRYYDYDVLRGLTFLTRWALKTGSPIPLESVEESVVMLDFQLDEAGHLKPGRNTLPREGTMQMQDDGTWRFTETSPVFPLLMQVSDTRKPSPFLTREWYQAIVNLSALADAGLLVLGHTG